ncbi:hypothetical protein C0993_011007 [Termitomyces sp. T159_Od127]|nr:hypothetical protein C0993_011007 [Termitomyces sp. T159_Od127]
MSRKRGSNAPKSSRERIRLSQVQSPVITITAHKEGRLQVPGAAAIRPHREPPTLPPHRALTRPPQRLPHAFPHPASRSATRQHNRLDLALLQPPHRRPHRLATHPDPACVPPRRHPERFQTYTDPISLSLAVPSLPALDGLAEPKQSNERELYCRRLVYYHYAAATAENNALRHAVLGERMGVLCRRLYEHAGEP